MRFIFRAGIAASLLCGASGVDGATSDTSKWNLMSEAARDYTVRYPDSFKVVVPKSYACSGQQCRATDELLLSGPGGSITFVAQRHINPRALAVQTWYESLAHRALQPTSETLIDSGGRRAVRRGPLVPAETVVMKQDKEVSRVVNLVHEETIFVPMNGTDILTISVHSKSNDGDQTLREILSTLTFTH